MLQITDEMRNELNQLRDHVYGDLTALAFMSKSGVSCIGIMPPAAETIAIALFLLKLGMGSPGWLFVLDVL